MRDSIDCNIPLFLGEIAYNGVSLPKESFSVKKLMNDTDYRPVVEFEKGYEEVMEWIKKSNNNYKG